MRYLRFAKATTPQEWANFYTHQIGAIDDCYRCWNCEIGVWNAHKRPC